MEVIFRMVRGGGSGEIVEKKSRFIADIRQVDSETEALAFTEEIRKKYWDARHHCSAFIIGKERPLARSSDDGEPQGTAGRPMLEVLNGADLRGVCAVVTRYFGGVLLGTGGLTRAYSGACAAGLAACTVLDVYPGRRVSVECDYSDYGKIRYMADIPGITCTETGYTDKVRMAFLIREDLCGGFIADVTNASGGRAITGCSDKVYLADDGTGFILV